MLARLLERADVFVQNLAPGAADAPRLGRGRPARAPPAPDRLRRLRATASSGPYARQEGLRPAGAGEAGLLSITGTDGRAQPASASRSPTSPPACTPTPASSRRCIARGATGEGTALDVSLFDALARVDGRAGLLHGVRRHAAGAHRRAARDRSRRTGRSRRRRRRGLSRRSRTRASGRASAPTCSAARRSPTTRASRPTPLRVRASRGAARR